MRGEDLGRPDWIGAQQDVAHTGLTINPVFHRGRCSLLFELFAITRWPVRGANGSDQLTQLQFEFVGSCSDRPRSDLVESGIEVGKLGLRAKPLASPSDQVEVVGRDIARRKHVFEFGVASAEITAFLSGPGLLARLTGITSQYRTDVGSTAWGTRVRPVAVTDLGESASALDQADIDPTLDAAQAGDDVVDFCTVERRDVTRYQRRNQFRNATVAHLVDPSPQATA